MQKQFNAVINGKGGVGKSFFAVNFVQYLKDNAIAHIAVDTDNENSTLKRFHPEALFLNIADPTEIDSVFDMLDKTDLVVMDCRAAVLAGGGDKSCIYGCLFKQERFFP